MFQLYLLLNLGPNLSAEPSDIYQFQKTFNIYLEDNSTAALLRYVSKKPFSVMVSILCWKYCRYTVSSFYASVLLIVYAFVLKIAVTLTHRWFWVENRFEKSNKLYLFFLQKLLGSLIDHDYMYMPLCKPENILIIIKYDFIIYSLW